MRHRDTTLGRGITDVGGEGRQGFSSPGGCAPPSFCVLQQSRSLLITDGSVLPRAPLSQDPSSRDGHLLLFCVTSSLTACSLCTLFLSFSPSHSLLLFSRGHSVSTRGTPLRAREWRLSRLARPFQRAGAIPSFLPASQPACLLAYLSTHPRLLLLPSFSHFTLSLSHPP